MRLNRIAQVHNNRPEKVQKPPPEAGFVREEATFPVKTVEAMWISYHGFKINQRQKNTVSPTMNWAGAAGHLNLRENDLPAGGMEPAPLGDGNWVGL